MALIEFKNKPDTSTPINAENLNHNFNELNTLITEIVESGENENGRWIKWADGTLICNGTIRNVTTPANSGTSAMITLPTSFLEAQYNVHIQMVQGQSYWGTVNTCINGRYSTYFDISTWNTGDGDNQNQSFLYTAIGKWK